MKRIFKFLMAFVVFFFLSSCSGSSHTHDYSSSWSFDENNHWHECISTEGICDKKKHNESPHNFDDGVLLDNATIGGNPVFAYTCMDCGFIKKEGKEHIHNYDILKFDDTHHWYECSSTLGNCPLKVSKKEAHNFNEGELKPASNNIFVYTCTTCGFTKEKVKQHIHNYSTSWSSDESYHFHECLNKDGCDEPVIDLLPHKFDQGKVVQEPIDGKDGTKEFICLDCGYKKYEAISFLNENTNFEALNSDKVTEQEWINAFNYNNVTISIQDKYSLPSIIKYDNSNNNFKFLNGGFYFEALDNGDITLIFESDLKYITTTDQYYSIIKQYYIDTLYNFIFKNLIDDFNNFNYDAVNKVYISENSFKYKRDHDYKNLTLKFNGGKLSQIRANNIYDDLDLLVNFYDYNNTIINLDKSLISNIHHCNYECLFSGSELSCSMYKCKECNESIEIKHDFNLVNKVLPTLNSNGINTYECKNCNYISKESVEYNYKENDDFNSIIGDNDTKLSTYFNNFSVKYHDVNNNKDIIIKFINEGLLFKSCLINDDGKVNGFKEYIDAYNGYLGYIYYDGTKNIKLDTKHNDTIYNYLDKYTSFVNKLFLNRIFENFTFVYNENKHVFELDLNGNVSFNNFLNHELIRFTKLDLKVKSNKIVYMDLEFIDQQTKEKCHYNLYFYDHEHTTIPEMYHYHRFTKTYDIDDGYIYYQCDDRDNRCDGRYSFRKHQHSFVFSEYIKPTTTSEGKKIYRCSCGIEKQEFLKKILDENSDFENIVSERNLYDHANIKFAKVKLFDVNNNIIKYMDYNSDMRDYIPLSRYFDYDNTLNSYVIYNFKSFEKIELKIYDDVICYVDVIVNNNETKQHYKIYIYDVIK